MFVNGLETGPVGQLIASGIAKYGHLAMVRSRYDSESLPHTATPRGSKSHLAPRDERHAALRDLAEGKVSAVFSVDLFNEGVDVPAVDTVLMLRPTESPTLFLQQLGRGLRRAPEADRAAGTGTWP